MSAEARGDLTAMLSEIRAGSPDAKDRLIRAIYDELLRTARGLMRGERREHTLEPGALVHEAVIRLLRCCLAKESRQSLRSSTSGWPRRRARRKSTAT
jgi:ECF sigma factor